MSSTAVRDLLIQKKQQLAQRAKHSPLEFQAYGYFLAENLADLSHRSIYIKMAKTIPRNILETAYHLVKEAAPNLKGPSAQAKLFMWKVKQLKQPKPLI